MERANVCVSTSLASAEASTGMDSANAAAHSFFHPFIFFASFPSQRSTHDTLIIYDERKRVKSNYNVFAVFAHSGLTLSPTPMPPSPIWHETPNDN